MKKIISVILMISLMLSMFAVSATMANAANSDEIEYVISEYDKSNADKIKGEIHGYMGDCDNDGITSVMDATEIQLFVANKKVLTDIQLLLADVDGDKYTSVMDATEIQLFAAQKITSDIINHILYTPETEPIINLKPEKNAKLTLWVPSNTMYLFKAQCRDFVAQYPDYNIKITVEAMSEGEATFAVINDPEIAADVFCFPCDGISRLDDARLLLSLDNELAPVVEERNSETSVIAATRRNKLLAYPITADNGYFLYYDKRYVSDEDAKTIEGIFNACRKSKKKFVMDAGNGYYACSFPFTGGLKTTGLVGDYQQFNDYNETEVAETMKAFATLFHDYDDVFYCASTDKISSGFSNKTVAAGIDGSWDAATIEGLLGKNYGVAKLPTITVSGTAKQMVSMHGFKMMGVNSLTDYPNAAQLLANYLTNEECQLERAEELSWGPSNTNAAESDIVKSNKTISAALEQAKYSVPQVDIAPTFWDPMGNLGTKLYSSSKYDLSTMKKLLKTTITNILDV